MPQLYTNVVVFTIFWMQQFTQNVQQNDHALHYYQSANLVFVASYYFVWLTKVYNQYAQPVCIQHISVVVVVLYLSLQELSIN